MISPDPPRGENYPQLAIIGLGVMVLMLLGVAVLMLWRS
jgi:hypothetical protein